LSVTNANKNGGKNTKCTEDNIGTPLLQNLLKNLQIKLKTTQRRFFQKWKNKKRRGIFTQTNIRVSSAPRKKKNTFMDIEKAHGDM
jgi:hypothetical protein